MRINSIRTLLAGVVILASLLACDAVLPRPTVSNIRMTTDESGKTATSTYGQNAAFYVFADLRGIANGSRIEARWYAVDVQGMTPNIEINTSDYTYQSGVDFVYFQLTTSDGGPWPTGSYRVDVYLDGFKTGEQGFTVQ